jgi:hypothetical protein
MYNLIIDTDFQKYQPQFNLSKILDIESVNINKFNKVYLYIDDLPIFYDNYSLFNPGKVSFLFGKNIKMRDADMFIFNVVNLNSEPIDIKDMVIKNKYIKDYLNGLKK